MGGRRLRTRAAFAAAAAAAAFACGAAAAAADGEPRPLAELPAAALAGDDECAERAGGGGGGDGACGLSALQLQGRRAARGSLEGALSGLGQILEIADGELPRTDAPPPVCDPTIVAETCSRVNRLTREYWGTAADADESVVHAAEIAEQLMVSRSSVLQYLNIHLGAHNMETDPTALAGGSFGVRCTELCNKTVQAVPSSHRPPTSDVACYMPKGAKTPKCNIDVSGNVFKHVLFDDHDPSEAASKFAESPERTRNETEADKDTQRMQNLIRHREYANSKEELKELEVLDYPPRTSKQLQISIANLFRVYPLVDIQVARADEETADVPAALETGSDRLRLGADWEDEVHKVGAQAQVFTAVALRGLSTPKADQQMQKWFGQDSPKSQKEVRRLVNGINSLLSNVDYVYPGKRCSDKTYAYVHPTPPYNMNSRGQYMFYLCDTYMRAPLGEKIETLVHEASHHQTLLTEDVCFSGSGASCTRAYGRTTCEKLAKQQPKKAIENADNVAYFVNDMQPNPPRPDCPTYPACSGSDFCGCPSGRERYTAKAKGGVNCYTCMRAPPPGSTKDTGGTCGLFHCHHYRGPTDCIEKKCICKAGYHAVRGSCKVN